jgi:hypothetical protein
MHILPRLRFVTLILLGLSALLLTACQPAEPEAPPAPQARTAAEVLARFDTDLKACADLVRVLETDRAFVTSFQSAKVRDAQPVSALLRKSAVAQTPAVAYYLGHEQYMELDVDFHGNPWAVAWVRNEPIFCAPTFERLSEIEAMGESGEAWRIRLYFLDKALEHLSPPWDEGAGSLVEFDSFKAFALEASQRYTGAQKAAFHAWLDKAIQALAASRKEVTEGAAGLTSQQQHQMLDERLSFLRQLALPTQ